MKVVQVERNHVEIVAFVRMRVIRRRNYCLTEKSRTGERREMSRACKNKMSAFLGKQQQKVHPRKTSFDCSQAPLKKRAISEPLQDLCLHFPWSAGKATLHALMGLKL